MLLELRVSNVVIIDDAILRPEDGLCVISGETGAGKSLLMDALALVRGDRAAARLIGPAGDEAQATAVIQVTDSLAQELADQLDVDCGDGQVILRRRVNKSGRSQAWINDVPVSVGQLRRVGERLIDIRAQHEHLRLSDPAHQRDLLDGFGGLRDQASAYRQLRARLRQVDLDIEELASGEADSLRERDFTRFLVEELEALQPEPGELERLEQRQALLAGAEDWRNLAAEAATVLIEADGSVVDLVGGLVRRLEDAPEPQMHEAYDLLSQAQALIDEAGRAVMNAAESIEVDEAERARIDQRLSDLLDAIRKHGGTEDALHQAWQELSERLSALEGLDERRASLEAERSVVAAAVAEAGAALKAARVTVFKRLAKAVHAELKDLGMPRAKLSMHETPCDGADVQVWHLQANPGMPAAPLSAAASGGEAARLALAVASVCAAQMDVPVLVFDEVDSGVGGRLGLAIAQRLRHLADGRSVLAITHTPQIAALAHRHYRVCKEHAAKSTQIRVEGLDGDERVSEIADMLGGGAPAREQALALLEVKTA